MNSDDHEEEQTTNINKSNCFVGIAEAIQSASRRPHQGSMSSKVQDLSLKKLSSIFQCSLEKLSSMLMGKGHHLNSTTREELLEHSSTPHVIMFYFAELTYLLKHICLLNVMQTNVIKAHHGEISMKIKYIESAQVGLFSFRCPNII